MNPNKKKNDRLGESYGTACHKLRKALLFAFAQKLGLTFCFRCGFELESPKQFSIDHKEAWLNAERPSKSFYDLDNIAFSHPSCNSRAGAKPVNVYPTKVAKEDARRVRNAASHRKHYHKERRRVKYLTTGN